MVKSFLKRMFSFSELEYVLRHIDIRLVRVIDIGWLYVKYACKIKGNPISVLFLCLDTSRN